MDDQHPGEKGDFFSRQSESQITPKRSPEWPGKDLFLQFAFDFGFFPLFSAFFTNDYD